MPWYLFTPCCEKDADPTDKNQYTLYGNGCCPPVCIGHLKVCAIQAMDCGEKPIITCDLEKEICRALENQTDTVNVLLKGLNCCFHSGHK